MRDSQGSLPRGVAWGHIPYIFSQQWHGTIYVKFCQSGRSLSLGAHVFFLGVSHIGTQEFMWLILGYSDHISPEQNQTFTINHIVRINLFDPAGRAWAEVLNTQKVLSGKIFQGPRSYLLGDIHVPIPEAGFSSVCVGIEQPRPAEVTFSPTPPFKRTEIYRDISYNILDIICYYQ